MRRTPDLVQLEDAAHGIVVAIAPSAGNLTREMTVKGHNILGPLGIPFLGPWANRSTSRRSTPTASATR